MKSNHGEGRDSSTTETTSWSASKADQTIQGAVGGEVLSDLI